jgi:hypothetical protein
MRKGIKAAGLSLVVASLGLFALLSFGDQTSFADATSCSDYSDKGYKWICDGASAGYFESCDYIGLTYGSACRTGFSIYYYEGDQSGKVNIPDFTGYTNCDYDHAKADEWICKGASLGYFNTNSANHTTPCANFPNLYNVSCESGRDNPYIADGDTKEAKESIDDRLRRLQEQYSLENGTFLFFVTCPDGKIRQARTNDINGLTEQEIEAVCEGGSKLELDEKGVKSLIAQPLGVGSDVEYGILDGWFSGVKSGADAYYADRATFHDKVPSWYMEDANWKEGRILPDTQLITRTDDAVFVTLYEVYGYFKNLNYCETYLSEESDDVDKDNNKMKPGVNRGNLKYDYTQSSDAIEGMYSSPSVAAEYYDSLDAAETYGCVYGQAIAMLLWQDARNGIQRPGLSDFNTNDDEKYQKMRQVLDAIGAKSEVSDVIYEEFNDEEREHFFEEGDSRYSAAGAVSLACINLTGMGDDVEKVANCIDGAMYHRITPDAMFKGTSTGSIECNDGLVPNGDGTDCVPESKEKKPGGGGGKNDPPVDTPDPPTPSEPTPPAKCTVHGKEELNADDPNCKEDLPPPADPCEDSECYVIEPCDVAALVTSDYYNIGEPNKQQEDYSIKQTLWDSFVSAGLTPEQAAAIMGNIQGVSRYNPASITTTTITAELSNPVRSDTESTENDVNADIDPIEEAPVQTTTESIDGLGLIHWGDMDVVEAMLQDYTDQDVFAPFFEQANWDLYGSEAVDGDRFIEIATENKVESKAQLLTYLQIDQILDDLKGTNFFDNTTIEEAAKYFWQHLVKTTGDEGTTVPASFIENAKAILAEFGDTEVTLPEDPPGDPTCSGDSRLSLVSAIKKLLKMVESSVVGPSAKNENYNEALTSSGINAQFDGKDAFAFVAAMVRASEFHPNYPVVAGGNVLELMDKYSSVWEKVDSGKKLADIKSSDLKVGDILITASSSHTMIYVGDQSFNKDADGKSLPFAMAVTGSSYPYYADASFDQANIYNVYRRQTHIGSVAYPLTGEGDQEK